MSAASALAERDLVGSLLNGASVKAAASVDPADFDDVFLSRVFAAARAINGSPALIAPVAEQMERDGTLGDDDVQRLVELTAEARYGSLKGDGIHRLAEIVRSGSQDRRASEIGWRLWQGEIDGQTAVAILSGHTSSATDSKSRRLGGSWVLDATDYVPALWGEHDRVLWSQGEPLMLVGPDGVGKTTLAQQLVLRRVGVRADRLLGLPIVVDERPVLYVAADRPSQAQRSFRRMVDEENRALLDERLIPWDGPLPFDLRTEPERLATFAVELGAGTLVLDSAKDAGLDLADSAEGSAAARAIQHVTAVGIETLILHHDRKDSGSLTKLADAFGSRWLTAVCGSVLSLSGEPGATSVRLRHLKQPAAIVGPLSLVHDHLRGVTVAVQPEATAVDADATLLKVVVAEVSREPGRPQEDIVKTVPRRAETVRAKLAEAVASGLLRVSEGEYGAKLHYPASDLVPTAGTTSDEVREPPRPDSSSRPALESGRTRSAGSSPDTPDEVGKET